jgi:hypothetical protein
VTPEPRKTRSRIDADGVKVTPVAGVRAGVWLIALALLLVGVAGLLALRVALPDGDSELEAAAPDPSAAGSALTARAAMAAEPAPAETRRVRPVRRQPTPPPPLPPGSTEAPRAEPPSLPEFPEDAGTGPTGTGLFPPPGTDPPKVGLLVPEDFPLPEGYVRHYQSTDDGEPLPAILMFHPDYTFFDEQGNQIVLPPDLVVPPEMAPPGMPQVPISIPAPLPDLPPENLVGGADEPIQPEIEPPAPALEPISPLPPRIPERPNSMGGFGASSDGGL